LLASVVTLALAFNFINGFHDSANAIATSVLTRALSMRNAVLLAGAQNFIGAVISTGVANTIAKGIVVPALLQGRSGQIVVLATVVAAIVWNLVTWWLGLPSSSSHALIGALVGAGVSAGGWGVLTLKDPKGIPYIIKGLVLSPIFGFARRRPHDRSDEYLRAAGSFADQQALQMAADNFGEFHGLHSWVE
jgi:PiT family inorganic phosphate transporter